MINKLFERFSFVEEKISKISEFDIEFYDKYGFNKLNYWVNEFNRINKFIHLTRDPLILDNDANIVDLFMEEIVISELSDKVNLYLLNYKVDEKEDSIVISGKLNYDLINEINEEKWPNLILSKHIINRYIKNRYEKKYNIYCGRINDIFMFYLYI